MKKERVNKTSPAHADENTMRPEYDFSKAKRGVTAKRYAQGTNVVVLDPDVARVFPTSAAVNDALRKLAEIIRDARGID